MGIGAKNSLLSGHIFIEEMFDLLCFLCYRTTRAEWYSKAVRHDTTRHGPCVCTNLFSGQNSTTHAPHWYQHSTASREAPRIKGSCVFTDHIAGHYKWEHAYPWVFIALQDSIFPFRRILRLAFIKKPVTLGLSISFFLSSSTFHHCQDVCGGLNCEVLFVRCKCLYKLSIMIYMYCVYHYNLRI